MTRRPRAVKNIDTGALTTLLQASGVGDPLQTTAGGSQSRRTTRKTHQNNDMACGVEVPAAVPAPPARRGRKAGKNELSIIIECNGEMGEAPGSTLASAQLLNTARNDPFLINTKNIPPVRQKPGDLVTGNFIPSLAHPSPTTPTVSRADSPEMELFPSPTYSNCNMQQSQKTLKKGGNEAVDVWTFFEASGGFHYCLFCKHQHAIRPTVDKATRFKPTTSTTTLRKHLANCHSDPWVSGWPKRLFMNTRPAKATLVVLI
ncbi:hypothetical protein BDQ17DRAFT_1328598 [Cyathus striatus]|nr:hypothetical protein BDQ17DRAFT_1328598 [Cyathus striatus]